MAAERTAVPFFENLRTSGLLSDAQLAELAKCPEARDPAPAPLARVVLQRGWLTRFQLNMIAAGSAKGLTVGPYLVLDRIGEGGMGTVYKARHQHMQRIVALKVIRKERLATPNALNRFIREVQLAGTLHHPNIVMAYDAGTTAGNTHYFAMEYVDGIDLARLVKEQGPLPVARACDYIRQAALGLQHAQNKGSGSPRCQAEQSAGQPRRRDRERRGEAARHGLGASDERRRHGADEDWCGDRHAGLHGAGAGHELQGRRHPR